jgi:hypothetical protein
VPGAFQLVGPVFAVVSVVTSGSRGVVVVAGDAEPEQIADASSIAAGGVDLVQNAVLA